MNRLAVLSDVDDYFESEDDTETEDDAAPLSLEELHQAYITGSDWTTETMVRQLRKGNIDLDPDFQRREVWNKKQKSRLIESIILNLPIPQIVLAERDDQKHTYIVLDGKQRLLTIRQFCVDSQEPSDSEFLRLTLSGLTLLKELNGKSYTDLTADPDYSNFVNAFDNSVIRAIVIRNWPRPDYLYRVFRRLNTANVQLSPQELRQALIPGPFTDFLDKYTYQNEELKAILRYRSEDHDFRMRDNEIVLRYLSFATRAETYSGNLKEFLDEAAGEFNSNWREMEAQIRDEGERLRKAILATHTIFGSEGSFRTYTEEGFGRRFNRAVFDIMTFYFRDHDICEAAIQSSKSVKHSFEMASLEDNAFQRSLTTTTKSKTATATRFVVWAAELSRATGLCIDPPSAFVALLEQ